MSGELLPCPFCGRDDRTDNAVQEACVVLTTFKSPAGGRAHRVECCCGTHGSSARAAEEAIAAWNTRMTTQQDSVDVERLRKVAEALLHGDPEANNGIRPAVTFADHSYPAYSAKQMLAFGVECARAALSLPITQRDEQGDNDAAEIAAVVEAWRDAKRLGLRVLTFGIWKPAAIRRLSIEQGDQDGCAE